MSEALSALADQLNASFAATDLVGRLRLLREKVAGRIVFTTSLGIEDQAITHAICTAKLDIELATLDTGRLFTQTYDLWAQTEDKYNVRIKPFYAQAEPLQKLIEAQGINGFYHSLEARKACCNLRKVEPLARALDGAEIWIAGLRADQSAHRSSLRYVEFDAGRNLIKASPILDWTRDEVAEFVKVENVPINALHENGFVSIGCAPCTRAIAPGEPERAGRWWWEDEAKKECGLHIGADGKIQRVVSGAPEAFETIKS